MKSFTEDPNQTRSKSLKALGILAAAYFVIEIIINHAVFRQMSYSGSFFSIMSMEFWGKIITGFGLALIISRFMTTSDAFKRFMQEKTKFKYKPWAASTYKLFALVCVFTIPLSFFLQNKLIDYIVESSTPEDRNKAILVMAAHGTITPFFKPIVKDKTKLEELAEEKGLGKPKAKKDESFSLLKFIKPELGLEISPVRKALYPFTFNRYAIHTYYVQEQNLFIQASNACWHIGHEAFGEMSDIDKVFFPYFSFKNTIDEQRYVEAVKERATCLVDHRLYGAHMLNGVFSFKNTLRDMHRTLYMPSASKYEKYSKVDKRRADTEWRKRMNEFYGFPTTIDASGEWPTYFLNHPDTVRYYEKMTGFKNLHPTADHFEERVKRYMKYHADEFILPGYTPTQMESINTPVDPDMTPLVGPRLDITDEMKDELGKSAYKSVILPIVVLGLSALFLIINSLLFLHAWASKTFPEKLTTPLLGTALLLVALLPVLMPSDLNNKEKGFLSQDGSVAYNYAVKWVYFHERNIAAAYEIISPARQVVSNTYNQRNSPYGRYF